MFNSVFEDLRCLGFAPKVLYQGGESIDLEFNPSFTGYDRRYMVLEVESLNEVQDRLIYKVRTSRDPRFAATNEIIFHEKIIPLMEAKLGPKLMKKFVFPEVITSKKAYPKPFMFMGKIEGSSGGKVNSPDYEVLTEKNILDLIYIMKTCRTITEGELLGAAPELEPIKRFERNKFRAYLRHLGVREARVRPFLGEKYYLKLKPLIQGKRALFIDQPYIFAAGDINPSNIIKTKEGKLGLIDWEQIEMTNNPAADYCMFFTVMWEKPELQARFFQKVLADNKDIPNFKELFRLEFIFNRGTGELGYWISRLKEQAKTKTEKDHCRAGIKTLTHMIKEAIDEKGLWA